MITKSIIRWLWQLLLQIPIDLLAYIVVPIAVKKARNTGTGFQGYQIWRLPRWASWWDNPEMFGAMGEPFWYTHKKWKSNEEQIKGWLLRNKAYGFRMKYIDPLLINPDYKVWGDQYIKKSTGRTGWLFATAISEGKLYWNFAAVIKIYKNIAWQPYVGWGFKKAAPVEQWDKKVLADHSASILRFTNRLGWRIK